MYSVQNRLKVNEVQSVVSIMHNVEALCYEACNLQEMLEASPVMASAAVRLHVQGAASNMVYARSF